MTSLRKLCLRRANINHECIRVVTRINQHLFPQDIIKTIINQAYQSECPKNLAHRYKYSPILAIHHCPQHIYPIQLSSRWKTAQSIANAVVESNTKPDNMLLLSNSTHITTTRFILGTNGHINHRHCHHQSSASRHPPLLLFSPNPTPFSQQQQPI